MLSLCFPLDARPFTLWPLCRGCHTWWNGKETLPVKVIQIISGKANQQYITMFCWSQGLPRYGLCPAPAPPYLSPALPTENLNNGLSWVSSGDLKVHKHSRYPGHSSILLGFKTAWVKSFTWKQCLRIAFRHEPWKVTNVCAEEDESVRPGS